MTDVAAAQWWEQTHARWDLANRVSTDPSAAVELFSDWRLPPATVNRLVDRIRTTPAPVNEAVLVALNKGIQPATLSDSAPSWQHVRRLVHGPGTEPTVAGTYWWLATLGERHADLQSRWQPPLAGSEHDATSAMLWASWGTAAIWDQRSTWEDLYLKPALGAFKQVLASRDVPSDVQRSAIADLREGLWYQLLGGQPAGWVDIATRVLESAAPDPVTALWTACSPESHVTATQCMPTHGRWPQTLAWVRPHVGTARARALQLGQSAEAPNSIATTHLVVRLIDAWERNPELLAPTRSAAVLSQNEGRLRARLRAVAALHPSWMNTLTQLPGLHHRTQQAVARWAWSFGWAALARGLSYDIHLGASAGCTVPDGTLLPLDDSHASAVQTWVLLVVLRGRLQHLLRWIRDGGTGDRDATWGRLLRNELPDDLADSDSKKRSYHRLRAWLSEAIADTLSQTAEPVSLVAQCPSGRGLRAAVEAVLVPIWNPDVPLPKSGFPTMVRHAEDAAKELAERGWTA